MAYKAWFTETIQWYVEVPDAATSEELAYMVFDGDHRIWDHINFVDSVTTIDEVEEM